MSCHPPIHPSTQPIIHPSVYTAIHHSSIYPPIHSSIHSLIPSSIHLSYHPPFIHLPDPLFIQPRTPPIDTSIYHSSSTHSFIHLSYHRPIHSFIDHLSIHPSIHPPYPWLQTHEYIRSRSEPFVSGISSRHVVPGLTGRAGSPGGRGPQVWVIARVPWGDIILLLSSFPVTVETPYVLLVAGKLPT